MDWKDAFDLVNWEFNSLLVTTNKVPCGFHPLAQFRKQLTEPPLLIECIPQSNSTFYLAVTNNWKRNLRDLIIEFECPFPWTYRVPSLHHLYSFIYRKKVKRQPENLMHTISRQKNRLLAWKISSLPFNCKQDYKLMLPIIKDSIILPFRYNPH